jgi:hypothetical protein
MLFMIQVAEAYVAAELYMALWFYIFVSDHNATDPVMQKRCNLRYGTPLLPSDAISSLNDVPLSLG